MSKAIPWRGSKRAAFIDFDGVLYASALKGQVMIDDKPAQLLSEEALIADLVSRVQTIVDEHLKGATSVFLTLSDRKNFRHRLLPSYKANRKDSARPIMLDFLRDFASEGVDGISSMLIRDLEADDVCGIAAGQFQEAGYETVIYSPDKDLLQIPGMTLTPSPVRDRVPVLSEVTVERADQWHIYQTLVGDTVDNYKGLPGYGPAKAEKLIETFEDPADRWEAVVAGFVAKGLTAEDALIQARVARILRYSDWDKENKEPILWTPPLN